ncbi:DUF1707 SHOCT-like domain-containing protein [Winogradskya humida]|nr:DUF1707 domain-containing protein [Actinoplanes humidus]
MRVSNADRDQVVSILHEAVAEGRLTQAESEERETSARAAVTFNDLAAVTADLPSTVVEPTGQTPDLMRIDRRFGTINFEAPWVVPKRIEIKLILGDVKLDFTQAVFNQDSVELDVDLGIGGDLVLVTVPGIKVVADHLKLRQGELKISPRAEDEDGDTPVKFTIKVSGRIRFGDIEVRPARRSPNEWVRGSGVS